MLTRLEVNGFKNLLDFAVDFGPFNCISGPNGVGKSNIFDAIRFLSLLADHSLEEAALKIRDGDPETTRLDDLFWTDGAHPVFSFRIVAEMIVEQSVVDDFGREAEATSTFLRYEIAIGFEPPGDASLLGRLILRREHLEHITEGRAYERMKFPHKPVFRKGVVRNKRRGGPFIFTEKAPPNPQQTPEAAISTNSSPGTLRKRERGPRATPSSRNVWQES